MLGSATYRLAAGRSVTLNVRLASGTARLASRSTRRIAASAEISTRDAAGNNASATRNLSLTYPRPRR